LKVELSASKNESKYKEFSARNYKMFDANEFAVLVKNNIQERQEYQLLVREQINSSII